jgi:hypothetical protein
VEEIDPWLEKVKKQIKEQLKNGPVVIEERRNV